MADKKAQAESRRYCILVNPTAGNGRALAALKKVETAMTQLSFHFRSVITHDVAAARREALLAVQQGEVVVAMGGDGTTRAIADILHAHQGTLALIPAGRGNDLARMLNIPTDPVAACKLLQTAHVSRIDMARVNQHPFLSICSLGLDSVANRIASQSTWVRGRAVYLYGGLRALLGWQPIKFNVTIDDQHFEYDGYSVAVANARSYGGGLCLVPEASLSDGLLDVVMIAHAPKWRIIKNIPRLLLGQPIKDPAFTIIRGKHIQIDVDPQFTLYADGDAIYAPPATIQVVPAALRVLHGAAA